MSLGDINWGSALVGAAAVTAFVAFGDMAVIGSLVGLGMSNTAAWTTVAAVGAVVGEFISDLTLQDVAKNCGNAAKSLIGR